jgi:hypothetical protein
MTDRPLRAPSGGNADDVVKPVRDEELTVDASVWSAWARSARSATDRGQLWGLIAAAGTGGLSAGIGLLLLLPSPTSWAVLFYAPVVGSIGAWLTSVQVRGRQFRSTAHEMRQLMVPGLVRGPSDDELRTLASTGHVILRSEYTVARVEDRLDLQAIRVLEYAPEQLQWGEGSESGGLAPGVGAG